MRIFTNAFVSIISIVAMASPLSAFEQELTLGVGDIIGLSSDCYNDCNIQLVGVANGTNIFLYRGSAIVAADFSSADYTTHPAGPLPPPGGTGIINEDFSEPGINDEGVSGHFQLNISWSFTGGVLRHIEVRQWFDPDVDLPCDSNCDPDG
jgi:hypothetical protein